MEDEAGGWRTRMEGKKRKIVERAMAIIQGERQRPDRNHA